MQQGVHHNPETERQANQRADQPHHGGPAQGRDGKRGDALERQPKQLEPIPFGDAGGACIAVVFDHMGGQPNPGKQAFHVAVAFRQLLQRIDGAPTHQTEVAGVGGNFDVAQAVEQAVKKMGAEPLVPRFARARAPLHADDVRAGMERGQHLCNELGRVL